MEKVITIGTIENIKEIEKSGLKMISFGVSFQKPNQSFKMIRNFATGWKYMIDKIKEVPEGAIVLVESELGKPNIYKDKNGYDKAGFSFLLKHFERLDQHHNPYSRVEDANKPKQEEFSLEDIFGEGEEFI